MTAKELAALARAEKMIPNAPVNAGCSVEIGTSVEVVWKALTTVSRWEQWYRYQSTTRVAQLFSSPDYMPDS